jgi:hypothetical protein
VGVPDSRGIQKVETSRQGGIPAAIGYPVLMKPMLASLSLFATVVLLGSTGAIAQESAQPSLPYVAVHGPEFISAPAATFMTPDDRVIGLTAGKTVKAYPAGILAQHGLVQDDSPSGPIAVTW